MIRLSAKVDYAVRGLAHLARHPDRPQKGDAIATAQQIPFRYLEATLNELRIAGIVASRRGAEGGYWLARASNEITLRALLEALDGPLVDVRAVPAGDERVEPAAEALAALWRHVGSSLAVLLDRVSLADLLDGRLPFDVER